MRVRSKLAGNGQALEGLPLKLMIILLLFSMTYPLFMSTFESYSDSMASQEVECEIEKLESCVISAFFGGPGSIRTVEVVLPSGMNKKPIVLEMGGTRGTAEARSLRYELGDAQVTKYIEDLPIDLSTPSGGPFLLTSPGGRVSFECVCDLNGTWIQVLEAI
jgi:hypothetical protein